MIDLDPKTSQDLNFSSQLIEPDPSNFYILSPEAYLSLEQLQMKKNYLLMLEQ